MRGVRMRLIDADALLEEIEENMNNGFPANENLSLYAISCLAHAPTVDVLEQIRDEIERLHYHPKLDFIKNDEVVEMALDIIDKYIAESEEEQCGK